MQAVLICGFPGEAFMGDLLRELDHGPAALPGAAHAAALLLVSMQGGISLGHMSGQAITCLWLPADHGPAALPGAARAAAPPLMSTQ